MYGTGDGAPGDRARGGLGNQLVKFNYRVRGGGPCRETCEGGCTSGEARRNGGGLEVKREEGFE